MPPSSLPVRPNLEHLRNQAKDLLKAYRSGEPSAIARFRESLPRYSLLTDNDLSATVAVTRRRSACDRGGVWIFRTGCKCGTTSNEGTAPT